VDAWFNSYRELNIDGANQSLRIIKNLIDAGSCQSYAVKIDICMLLEFTNLIIRTKLSDAYGLVTKVLSEVRKWFLFPIKY
jgi:fused